MAFINDHEILFGSVGSVDFFLDNAAKIVVPMYGYALTQSTYDGLSNYNENYYYVVLEETSTEEIREVVELSQEEYEVLIVYASNTLYIIKNDDTIEGAYFGDTQASKLYLGSNELWTSEITPPSWFTPEWYAEAKTYLDGQFTFKPSGLYLDLIHSYYPEFDPTKETQGIVRMYWWNNPPPSEPIKIFIDPTFVSNNEKWWTMQTATASADYCHWGTFYKDQGIWYSHTSPRTDNQASMHFLGGIHTSGTPIYAPAMFYAGGTVTAEITQMGG